MGHDDKSDTQPLIYFEVVPEGKSVKNRLHLNIAAADRKVDVARLVALGATEVEEMSPLRVTPGRTCGTWRGTSSAFAGMMPAIIEELPSTSRRTHAHS